MSKKAVGLRIGSGVVVLLCLLVLLGTAVGSPDTFTVNATDDTDDGTCDASHCSLREAINAANSNPGSDTIEFNIPDTDPNYSGGVWTISLTASLPTLSGGGTVISGTTQAAFIGGDPNPYGPEIEISGAGMASGGCLGISSANNVIHGLVINRCPEDGIYIIGSEAPANTISGNYIGTDATGSSDLGNSYFGVAIVDGAQNNTIGGDTSGERNVISGNDVYGVLIYSSGTSGNTVSGNYIGTDATGSSDLGNSYGVIIGGGAQNNTIGGDTPGERNLISGNDQMGVFIVESGTNGNTVSGNYIGTDAAGSSDLGNSYFGVVIVDGAQNNTIGGDTSGERNIISGNDEAGVLIIGSGTDGNTISGNYIGTDASGSLALPNYRGVFILEGAQNNTIGPSNLIAFNGVRGVEVVGATTTGNTITQNGIHSNSGPGIELGDGGNTELSPPTISRASCNSISGTAPANATVELFTGPDEEGKTYLTTVSADGEGSWSASDSFAGDIYFTATATDASGNTSEFSTAVDRGCYYIYLPLTTKNY